MNSSIRASRRLRWEACSWTSALDLPVPYPYSREPDIFRFVLLDPVQVDAFGYVGLPGQGITVKVSGRLILSQIAQVGDQAECREEGAGVVVAKQAPTPGQGVLVEFPCFL
jgi:hypothetical protein